MSDETLSRRAWLRGAFLKGEAPKADPSEGTPTTAPTPKPPPVRALPVLRPPGALPEAEFLATCTGCGDCITACPHKVLFQLPPRRGPHLGAATGTPTFDPAVAPCLLCEDMPCAVACAPGALSVDLPAKMGTAMVRVLDCLVSAHLDCTVCAEHCPVPWVISQTPGAPPTIDPKACTGCGVCLHVCPAPSKAIILMPRPVAAPAPRSA